MLALLLHLTAMMAPFLPPGRSFFDYTAGSEGISQKGTVTPIEAKKSGNVFSDTQPDIRSATMPYRLPGRIAGTGREYLDPPSLLAMPVRLPAVDSPDFHALSRRTAGAKLLPPLFSDATIPRKPAKNMGQMVEESEEAYLLGDVFRDAVPAVSSGEDPLSGEAAFLADLRQDILDGRLDMPFASFIIAAEYYQLSRALLEKNLQPAFSLAEAFDRYRLRLDRIGAGVPKEIDGFTAVTILQRYAENKFYPGNGSGMLLDSLFHNLNDCEGGTKEVLAYLDALYPDLVLGSNRGMLQTTTGESIGHMQVYLGPDPATRKIIENDRGVVLETTRVSRESILPYVSGEVFPPEDFVVRYYPEIVAGTPLADSLRERLEPVTGHRQNIVGTSDHPLKMSYGGIDTLLSAQFYDLANIRTRKIENEFLRSNLPSCDPRIDPTRIDRANLFSNFVTIDRTLRKSLIDHYLADLEYWDNKPMPHWQAPAFVATYADLAGSLLGEKEEEDGFIQVDAENTVSSRSLLSHKRFLLSLRDAAAQAPDKYIGTGRQECRARTVLDSRLLAFLFEMPKGPGFYFLPMPAEDFSWQHVLEGTVNDCLAVPVEGLERSHVAALEEEAALLQTSFRRELYRRAMTRGLASSPHDSPLEESTAALVAIFTGLTGNEDPVAMLAERQSAESTPEEPSIRETAGEVGRTGINSGLIWDAFDFLGGEKTRGLILAYADRDDLVLSVRRAAEFMQSVVTILSGQQADPKVTETFLAHFGGEGVDRTLALAAAINLARLQNLAPSEVSAIAVRYLQQRQSYRAETLLDLLSYGLQKEDAVSFVHRRIEARIALLPSSDGSGAAGQEVFIELVELIRTVNALTDPKGRQALAEGLLRSLNHDFSHGSAEGNPLRPEADFGVIFNKLAVLALLRETDGGQGTEVFTADAWLENYIRFAGLQPVGKLMIELVDKIHTPEAYATALAGVVGGQFAELARIEAGLPAQADKDNEAKSAGALRAAGTILGDANVLVQILLQADVHVAASAVGLPSEQSSGRKKSPAAFYLERVHRGVAEIVAEVRPGAFYPAEFYLDDRVRESFAMLAYVQDKGNGEGRIKFRKIQDIRTIKDPSKIRVIEAERKITRQDMSLLTLALNEDNSPPAIRRAWDDTLAVADMHLGLNPFGPLKEYLFASHFPYLLEDDLGFFFSPETVEDFHNAEQWGGRNDILLSSYLHFRNLPEHLPDWLLRTAMARSRFEQQIVKKFEQQSFLPMILECTSDYETLPDSLFRAQWAIRKPFGEDIFPGTLLLLRLGYMTINSDGEIVLTPKYTG
ncbi:MAG: hypothetical protein VR65_26005 [Desulfobulbaceae bacterium BRH_c16a]|nr:MAG: hypothetical protein VR65_26005 [Desulfobulbaceae bacterium BRH_c16a]